jgi:hypothetical protein
MDQSLQYNIFVQNIYAYVNVLLVSLTCVRRPHLVRIRTRILNLQCAGSKSMLTFGAL